MWHEFLAWLGRNKQLSSSERLLTAFLPVGVAQSQDGPCVLSIVWPLDSPGRLHMATGTFLAGHTNPHVPVLEGCIETHKTEDAFEEDQRVQAKQVIHVVLFLDLGVESLGMLETL